MKKLILVTLLALGLIGATSDLENSRQSNKIFNRDVGFAITKLPSWHFLSLDSADTWMTTSIDSEKERNNLKRYIQSLRDQETSTGMAPIFIAKHQEPYPHINPMIKVVLHYIDDLPKDVSPLAIAAVMAQSFSENNQGFKMLSQVQLARLSDFDAGYIRFSIEGKLASGEKESAVNQVYLVPRGKFIFEITISTPLKYDAAMDADLEEMMDSIFILKSLEV